MATIAEPITWEMSLPEAQERARREGKPVLLDFSAAPE
jgi:uncharacterized protein YyaL (SSP411 family)